MRHAELLANIAPKRLYAYTAFMQAQGKSAATIKTDLVAIRFFHDQMPNPRYRLPDNSALSLERRSFGKLDRTWRFNRMFGKALALGRQDYILAFYLARYASLRIHECFRNDTAMAEKALKENTITVKDKGGKIRTMPINEPIALALRKQLAQNKRGHKLLVPDGVPTAHAIHALQAFIIQHREAVQDKRSTRPLTFHGLRHSCASLLIAMGWSLKDVQEWLGHSDIQRTANIYSHLDVGRKVSNAASFSEKFKYSPD